MLLFWCVDAMSLAFTHCCPQTAKPHPAVRMDLHSEISVYCFFPPGRQFLGKAQNLRNFQMEFSYFFLFLFVYPVGKYITDLITSVLY